MRRYGYGHRLTVGEKGRLKFLFAKRAVVAAMGQKRRRDYDPYAT